MASMLSHELIAEVMRVLRAGIPSAWTRWAWRARGSLRAIWASRQLMAGQGETMDRRRAAGVDDGAQLASRRPGGRLGRRKNWVSGERSLAPSRAARISSTSSSMPSETMRHALSRFGHVSTDLASFGNACSSPNCARLQFVSRMITGTTRADLAVVPLGDQTAALEDLEVRLQVVVSHESSKKNPLRRDGSCIDLIGLGRDDNVRAVQSTAQDQRNRHRSTWSIGGSIARKFDSGGGFMRWAEPGMEGVYWLSHQLLWFEGFLPILVKNVVFDQLLVLVFQVY